MRQIATYPPIQILRWCSRTCHSLKHCGRVSDISGEPAKGVKSMRQRGDTSERHEPTGWLETDDAAERGRPNHWADCLCAKCCPNLPVRDSCGWATWTASRSAAWVVRVCRDVRGEQCKFSSHCFAGYNGPSFTGHSDTGCVAHWLVPSVDRRTAFCR